MTTDSEISAQYLKLIAAGFLIFVLVFVSHDFEVGSNDIGILKKIFFRS